MKLRDRFLSILNRFFEKAWAVAKPDWDGRENIQ
jgi:hypothetical protein